MSPVAASDQGRARPRTSKRELVAGSATLVAFAMVFGIYALWLGKDFMSMSGRMFDLAHSAPQLIMAIGLVVCLSCHQFDLSVGSMATLSVFLTIGLHVKSGLPMAATIAISIAVGAAGGLVNALLVTRLKVNAFIATLGTGGIYGGLTIVYSQGQVVGPSPTTRSIPQWFTGSGSIGDFQEKAPAVVVWIIVAAVIAAGIVSFEQRFPVSRAKRPQRWALVSLASLVLLALSGWTGLVKTMNWTIVILLVLAMTVWIILKYTGTGRSVYAVGGSVRAAKFAGINTDLITTLAFVLSGVSAAVAGVVLASVQGSAVPGIAESVLLPAYTAAFLSTVLLSRSRFHVWGTVFGGIFLVYVSSGLVSGGVPFTWTQVINGGVLVATVSLSTFLRRR